MLKLIDVNERTWQNLRDLSASQSPTDFPGSAVELLVKGYVYRAFSARVIGIADDDALVGVALVRDSDAEPACYDLQLLMIDRRNGYGAAALRLLLSMLERERKFDRVETRVRKADPLALRVYEEVGFADAGQADDEAPDSLRLAYDLRQGSSEFKDTLISDFSDPLFQSAFQTYFAELGITVKDWGRLFREMNGEEGNQAYVRTTKAGTIVGFIQFQPIKCTSWFFEETCGFIREFWVSEAYRGAGHGTALIRTAERFFKERGICTILLTTDTAERFYLKRGYQKAPGCAAKNKDDVFVKRLV